MSSRQAPFLPVAGFSLTLLSVSVLSASVHANEHGFTQHESHEHGVVELHLAQDQNLLLAEITAPGADVIGFEHALQNEEQHHELEEGIAKLKQGGKLLNPNSEAGCSLASVDVDHTYGDEHDHHEGEGHDEHEHEHEHEHEKHDHAEHKEHDEHHADEHDDHHDDEHGDHHEPESGHAGFTASYEFKCDNMDELESVKVNWFTHFPSTQEIEAQAITERGQFAAELDKNKSVISLR